MMRAIYVLAYGYYHGLMIGIQEDRAKAIELFAKSVD